MGDRPARLSAVPPSIGSCVPYGALSDAQSASESNPSRCRNGYKAERGTQSSDGPGSTSGHRAHGGR
jgi:hypothetical protein